jgi:tetratricopeptide (TPR) repeat protein
MKRNHHEVALGFFVRALENDSGLLEGWLNRGQVESSLGNLPASIRSYNRAMRLSPGNAWPYLFRGVAYLRERFYAAADQDFSRAIALLPEWPIPHSFRTICLVLAGKPVEAKEVGDYLMTLGRPDEAKKALAAARSLAPPQAWPEIDRLLQQLESPR